MGRGRRGGRVWATGREAGMEFEQWMVPRIVYVGIVCVFGFLVNYKVGGFRRFRERRGIVRAKAAKTQRARRGREFISPQMEGGWTLIRKQSFAFHLCASV